MQFVCMVEKGYYPAESELLLPLPRDAGRMRGTFALLSAWHPLEAQRLIGALGAFEVRKCITVYIVDKLRVCVCLCVMKGRLGFPEWILISACELV